MRNKFKCSPTSSDLSTKSELTCSTLVCIYTILSCFHPLYSVALFGTPVTADHYKYCLNVVDTLPFFARCSRVSVIMANEMKLCCLQTMMETNGIFVDNLPDHTGVDDLWKVFNCDENCQVDYILFPLDRYKSRAYIQFTGYPGKCLPVLRAYSSRGFLKIGLLWLWGHQAKRVQSWVTRGTLGSRLPAPSLCNMYILLNIKFFYVSSSDLAPLSSVYPHRRSLP